MYPLFGCAKQAFSEKGQRRKTESKAIWAICYLSLILWLWYKHLSGVLWVIAFKLGEMNQHWLQRSCPGTSCTCGGSLVTFWKDWALLRLCVLHIWTIHKNVRTAVVGQSKSQFIRFLFSEVAKNKCLGKACNNTIQLQSCLTARNVRTYLIRECTDMFVIRNTWWSFLPEQIFFKVI